jgi:pimeloyl-ACP methyl ester carboxylesterase
MRPFTIAVPQAKLDAIRARIAAFPWFPAPTDEGDSWGRGVNTAWLKALCGYWLNTYDWRAEEAKLNARPQFITTVDGLDVHFLHVVGEAQGRRPLLITHGWPGGVLEFYDSIGPLAFPSAHGGKPEDAFDLVIPALPGYGFSGKPEKPLGQRATASVWQALMARLGYDRYLAQGGDWGGMVTSWLALEQPGCIGAHLNMIGFRPTPATPQTDAEAAWLTRTQMMMQAEGAYFMQQATKPQTLAMALMDSPVGAAAWILEKFHGWSDLGTHGDLLKVYSREALLTNVMVYLVNDAMATGVWYYRALLEEGGVNLPAGARVEKPVGFANFPGEKLYTPPPRSWAQRAYNIVHWSEMDGGGHFAAMERPAAFVADVRAFARAIGY